jgi:hypothetical protein
MLMVRLQERVDVGGNGGGGQGHCDLKLKVDAIKQVHVVVQLGLFVVVVESHLVAEVHVEAREGEQAGGCSALLEGWAME